MYKSYSYHHKQMVDQDVNKKNMEGMWYRALHSKIGTSLKHSSFGDDKAPKIFMARTNTARTCSWNSTVGLFTYQQVKWHILKGR